MLRLGINGFGRIGRNFIRAAFKDSSFTEEFEVMAVNDITDAKTLAYLFKYDSALGVYSGDVSSPDDNTIIIDGKKLKVLRQNDPAKLPWKELSVSIVLESTGKFTAKADADKHIQAGAKKVVISAPSKDADATIVMGVNQSKYESAKHNVISMASCTTGALAPVAKVLNDKFGIEKGFMTTAHAYTMDQKLLDAPHSDLRRARAAAVSIIPTTTGAASAIGMVLPELEGKLDGLALRVPVPDVSINDLVVLLKKQVTLQEVKDALKSASITSLKGIIEYTEESLVSIDVLHNPHSSIVDGLSINVLGKKNNLVKVLAWYDNEWGYSCRLVDLIKYIGGYMN
ncbi:MAG: type I glyceraldehyde-3-phosphate dehydrogenase [Candidatus Atabeyarchaeum deiterrae]